MSPHPYLKIEKDAVALDLRHSTDKLVVDHALPEPVAAAAAADLRHLDALAHRAASIGKNRIAGRPDAYADDLALRKFQAASERFRATYGNLVGGGVPSFRDLIGSAGRVVLGPQSEFRSLVGPAGIPAAILADQVFSATRSYGGVVAEFPTYSTSQGSGIGLPFIETIPNVPGTPLAEGAPVPSAEPTFGLDTGDWEKHAVQCVVSAELLEDGGIPIDATIERSLTQSLASAVNDRAWSVLAAKVPSVNAAPSPSSIFDAVEYIADANHRAVIVAGRPGVIFDVIDAMTDVEHRRFDRLGLRFVADPWAPAATLLVGDPEFAVWATKADGIMLDVARMAPTHGLADKVVFKLRVRSRVIVGGADAFRIVKVA